MRLFEVPCEYSACKVGQAAVSYGGTSISTTPVIHSWNGLTQPRARRDTRVKNGNINKANGKPGKKLTNCNRQSNTLHCWSRFSCMAERPLPNNKDWKWYLEITKPDNCSGLVVSNRQDNANKMEVILNESAKFRNICTVNSCDSTIKIETRV